MDIINGRGNKFELFFTGHLEASASLRRTLESPPNISEEKLNLSLLRSWV